MKRFLSGAKSIVTFLIHLILFLTILLALLLFLPKLKGIQVYTVLSSSMEPALPVGSIIYVNPCKSASEIQEQEVIAYEAGTTLVVHRVIEADWQQGVFVTKGDFNKVADASPVTFDHVVGKVQFHIPWIGYVLMMVQKKEFRYLFLVLAGLLLALTLPIKNRRTYEQEHIKQN